MVVGIDFLTSGLSTTVQKLYFSQKSFLFIQGYTVHTCTWCFVKGTNVENEAVKIQQIIVEDELELENDVMGDEVKELHDLKKHMTPTNVFTFSCS